MIDVHYSSKNQEWFTPPDLYSLLHSHFNFTLDPCTSAENPLATARFFTEETNGLSASWANERVFCNPPYADVALWLKKATTENVMCVFLIPARTDTKYFHDFIFKKADWIIFLKGRLKFSASKNSAPFPSCLVGFNCATPNVLTDLPLNLRGKLLNIKNSKPSSRCLFNCQDRMV